MRTQYYSGWAGSQAYTGKGWGRYSQQKRKTRNPARRLGVGGGFQAICYRDAEWCVWGRSQEALPVLSGTSWYTGAKGRKTHKIPPLAINDRDIHHPNWSLRNGSRNVHIHRALSPDSGDGTGGRNNENIFKYISNLYEEFSEKINELIK